MADGFERLLRRNMGKKEHGSEGGGFALLEAAAAASARQNGGRETSYPAQQQQPGQAHQEYPRAPEIYTSSSQTTTPNLLHPQHSTASPTTFPPSGPQQQ